MRKVCAECGEEFEAKRKAATYCSGRCTKRAQRRPKEQQQSTVSSLRVSGQSASTQMGSVMESTQAELEAAGREESAAGQSALALARRIDASSGETGSGVAALVREHRGALAEALKDAKKATDDVDELKAKRERKLASG